MTDKMTDKQLRMLSRTELLEMLLEQAQENEKLQAENEALKKNLETEKAQMEEKLKSRELRIEKAGSIAEAALALNGVFEAAEASCVQYVENVRRMSERQDAIEKEREAKSKRHADIIIRDARDRCIRMEQETKQKCDEMLAEADQRVEEKWTQISTRLNALYQSHEGLMELVSQGLSLVPGRGVEGEKKQDE